MNRPVRRQRRLGRDPRGAAEELEQRAVEAVEDDEAALVRVVRALAGPAPEHLLEEDAGLHRAQQDDELQVGDVHSGREQVHGDRHHRPRPVAELADALQRPVRLPGDLLHELLARAERLARQPYELVGVGGVVDVVRGEDERLGKPAVLLLVLERVLLQLLDDLPVRLRRRDVALDLRNVEIALVLEGVAPAPAVLHVDDLDRVARLEEEAVHADARADRHNVVVDQVALADGALVLVPVDDVIEVRGRVQRRRGGEPDLRRVEVVDRAPPDGVELRGVAAVALVGDHQVEGVDRDVQRLLGRVVVDRLVALAEDRGAAEEVDRHALDRADVDERVPLLRPGQVLLGQDLRVVPGVVAEVLALEAVAVDLVDLVELEPGLGRELAEGAHGLRRERPAIDEEQDPLGGLRLHQAVDLVDQGEGLAGAGRHGDEHADLALGHGLLDGGVRLALVRAQARVVVGHPAQGLARGVVIVGEALLERLRRVVRGDVVGGVERLARVEEADDRPVGGVEEGDVVFAEGERASLESLRVPRGLHELRRRAAVGADRFDDGDDAALRAERVVGGAVRGGVLLDGAPVELRRRLALDERHDLPPGMLQGGVDLRLARRAFAGQSTPSKCRAIVHGRPSAHKRDLRSPYSSGRIFPGLSSPAGSKAAFIRRCRASSSGDCSRRSASRLAMPMPCSPEIVPPRREVIV